MPSLNGASSVSASRRNASSAFSSVAARASSSSSRSSAASRSTRLTPALASNAACVAARGLQLVRDPIDQRVERRPERTAAARRRQPHDHSLQMRRQRRLARLLTLD
jgi:hypothetical protein